MVEINYQSFEKYLSDLTKPGGKKTFAPVYLLFGEELLYKTALGTLVGGILPASQIELSYDSMEGTHDNIPRAIERVNTFSLVSGTKVVALLEAKIFHSKQNESIRFDMAKDAYDQQDLKKAAIYFLGILESLKVSLDDIYQTNKTSVLGLNTDESNDHSWIDDLITYCKDHQLAVSAVSSDHDNVQELERAIEKGFPRNNHLIITAEIVDKRRRLYNTIRERGVIIDCSVPAGERRADKAIQEAVLADRAKMMLGRYKKTLNNDAYEMLFEMTGFDLRTFSNSLQKLIDYVGDRKDIRTDDVVSVLERSKKDPIYELTNAVSDRNAENALFYLNSLLTESMHPLQALAAVTNAVRKLLVVKSFVESPEGRVWRADCQYNQFQSSVMPAVRAHDRQLLDRLTAWEHRMKGSGKGFEEKSKGKPKKNSKTMGSKIRTDLLIAKNPGNVYPIFQTFKKSVGFTMGDLIRAIAFLAEADQQLKSTGQNPRLVLENAVIRICGIRGNGV